jgi:plastocyanin
MKHLFVLFVSILSLMSLSAFAETVEVGQKDKAFTVTELTIKKGDTIRFINMDPFFHNVFSLSDAKLFDLGSFPQNDHRDIVFDEAGIIEIECAIHPSMLLEVMVQE